MTVKGLAQKIISNLPDEATFDDIQYQLYVLECIEKGEQDVANGKFISESQVLKGLEKWLK
jgi:predicted transcriptional regulator